LEYQEIDVDAFLSEGKAEKTDLQKSQEPLDHGVEELYDMIMS